MKTRNIRMGFSVDPNLLVELSRKLVSRDEVALLELVKNSWDADATCVEVMIEKDRISVRDNGVGMDEDAIRNGWMRLGTTSKLRSPKSPSGRKVLGSKGLGRLAVFRLGKRAIIQTKAVHAGSISVIMQIPAISAESEGKSSLDDFPYDFELDTEWHFPFPCNGPGGTAITVEDLYRPPSGQFVENLRNSLSDIAHLSSKGDLPFTVTLTAFGEEKDLTLSDQLPDWDYEVDATFGPSPVGLKPGEDPKMVMEIRYRPVNDGPIVVDRVSRKLDGWKKTEDGGVGNFSLKMQVWDLDRHMASRKDIRARSGISVVRNGFATVSPKIDWLGLNMRRVNRPTIRLSTNQVSGAVHIDSENNPNLEEKTDREGLLENEAFYQLTGYILRALDTFEGIRGRIRNSLKPGKGAVLDDLDTSDLKELAKVAPSEISSKISAQAERIDFAREKLEEILLGKDRMASLGILAARVVHETKNALTVINGGYSSLRELISSSPSVPREILETLERIVKAGQAVNEIMNGLANLIRFRGGRILPVRLDDVVNTLSLLYDGELMRMHLTLTKEFVSGFEINVRAPDLYVMLANLIDNSVYWIGHSGRKNGRIAISASSDSLGTLISVDDSGPGISADDEELIFEPGFSRKPEGTGFGLATIQDIARSYGGYVRHTKESREGGARFEIFIPFKS